jgi:ferredoxin-type protein NapF
MTGGRVLRRVRIAVAAIVLSGLLAGFLAGRHTVAARSAHLLASIQFVPSAVALATGSALSLGAVAIVVLTLLAGRVYCSALCPLGILQDLVHRLAHRGRPRIPPPRPGWLRAVVIGLVVAALASGGAGIALALLDPYSIFGRIAGDLIRPAVSSAANLLAAIGLPGLERSGVSWTTAGALLVSVAMLVLVTGFAAWRGRLYCNTICPVGTLLGWLAARSAFRLTLDRETCRKCAACLHVCKAGCIDLRRGTIDAARCVACFDCLGVCPDQGIRHRWTWRRRAPAEASSARRPVSDPARRAFVTRAGATLVSLAGGSVLLALASARRGSHSSPADGSRMICPPGAGDLERFLDRCTACHLCIAVCPTHVLQPAGLDQGWAGLTKPRLDYRASFCNFDCHACSDVCPDGALTPLTLAEKHRTRIGVADFTPEHCIVQVQHTDCAACSEHCPTKAVDTVPFGDDLRLPQVNSDLCIGCGACEYACPAKPEKAIRVTGRSPHGLAAERRELPATDPRPAGDFPF